MPAQPLAVCTWVFGHHDHARIAADVSRLGLSGVEVLTDIDHQPADEIGSIYGERGLEIVSLTPDNVDLAHVDPTRRTDAIRYYERLIAYAAALGCPTVTCHETVGRPLPHDDPDREWARLVKGCVHLAEVARQHAVQLAFEPLHRGLVSAVHDTDAALQLLVDVAHPALSIAVDTFHLDRETSDPAAAIRRCSGQVGLVQLSDSGRLPLGTGHAPVAECLHVLTATGYRGAWVLECTTQLTGPSLQPREVNLIDLEQTLRTSVEWLMPFRSPDPSG